MHDTRYLERARVSEVQRLDKKCQKVGKHRRAMARPWQGTYGAEEHER